MSALVDNTSSRAFATEHLAFLHCCQDFIGDLKNNGLSLHDEISKRLDQLDIAFGRLRRAGQKMVIDCPESPLACLVPEESDEIDNRAVQAPVTEFDWACTCTQDTLDLLTDDFMHHSNPALLAHSLEIQAALLDFGGRFPESLFLAESALPPILVNARIPFATRMASRIPRAVRSRPVEASPKSKESKSK
ncbi:hypothetical protein N7475_007982 [Penicillium sp. IBT 31633x]|nr:hypothetical protein N7475_007982 [Penicillium sp. IBT 31633x]